MIKPADSVEEFLEECSVEEEARCNEGPGSEADRFVQEVEDFFAPGGPLSESSAQAGRDYEFRAQQQEMAVEIARALVNSANSCIEAPTGVGKSFAYLVPLILHAKYSTLPAVVSTETIHLQEQLITKDLPQLAAVSGMRFKAALAKGRGNYLCRRRLAMAAGEVQDSVLPAPSLLPEARRMLGWGEDESCSGERDSVPFPVDRELWPLVCCESANCLKQKCRFFRSCFYWRSRREWENADVIVANHALFFTDLKMRTGGEADAALLPEYGPVVIDEAHTLENSACEHLGLRLSQLQTKVLLQRLYHPVAVRGLLMRKGDPKIVTLRGLVAETLAASESFFSLFGAELDNRDESTLRLHNAGRFPDLLSAPLGRLCEALGDYIDGLDDEGNDFKSELESQRSRCLAILDGVAAFLAMSIPESVYWIERERDTVVLQAAPLNVAELLGTMLFDRSDPVILSSATLTVRGSFDYFCTRVGFHSGDALMLDSPYRADQVKLYVTRTLPDPLDAHYIDALIEAIPHYVAMTHGKAFVLFTSHHVLRQCADALRDYFEREGIRLLVQGEDMTRSMMLRVFREDIDSVLFGTDSFWTGVDVPGEALSNVIVTKLPFAQPTHPLTEARDEAIKRAGGNSFRDYALPEAVLKLRQGVGRLIRRRTDTGIVVVLDRRLMTKSYGRTFLDSLPDYPMEIG